MSGFAFALDYCIYFDLLFVPPYHYDRAADMGAVCVGIIDLIALLAARANDAAKTSSRPDDH